MKRAIVNAQIWTMHPAQADVRVAQDDASSWQGTATAMLFDESIIQIGSDSAILREAQRVGARVEDLDGRVVVPGFVDAHTHFVHIGIKRMRPALGGAKTREEALEWLATWLTEHPGTGPVIAEGWDESQWPGHAWLRREELDDVLRRVKQNRMLVARRICGHIATASAAALAPLQARWPSLVDAETGIALEDASLYLNEVLGATDAELQDAIRVASRTCRQLGLTTVGDYSQAPYRKALLQAAKDGGLGVRVVGSIYVQQLDEAKAAGFRTGTARHAMLHDGGLKVFLDGSLGARSAALRESYLDAPSSLKPDCPKDKTSRFGCVGHPHPKGTLNWSDDDVNRLFHSAHAAGIQLHAHAIGDAAIDQGLAYFAELAAHEDVEAHGWKGNALRHRFEHYEIVHDEQAARTAELGIVASSQPNFVGAWSSKHGMYEERLGPLFQLNNRFRAFKEKGVPLAFGSDGMPPGPLVGLQSALNHPVETERLEIQEAIWHYTYAAAWSLHAESRVGSLGVGKMADLVVLGTRKLNRAPERWGIHECLVAGRRLN